MPTTDQSNPLSKQLAFCLLFARLTLALVFLVWTFDKFANSEHTIAVFSHFYGVTLPTWAPMLLGGAQLILVIAFLLGLWRNITYLFLLLMHAATTLVSLPKYFDPLNNLLFFAAWPMLAACLFLYVFRHYDTWTINR